MDQSINLHFYLHIYTNIEAILHPSGRPVFTSTRSIVLSYDVLVAAVTVQSVVTPDNIAEDLGAASINTLVLTLQEI